MSTPAKALETNPPESGVACEIKPVPNIHDHRKDKESRELTEEFGVDINKLHFLEDEPISDEAHHKAQQEIRMSRIGAMLSVIYHVYFDEYKEFRQMCREIDGVTIDSMQGAYGDIMPLIVKLKLQKYRIESGYDIKEIDPESIGEIDEKIIFLTRNDAPDNPLEMLSEQDARKSKIQAQVRKIQGTLDLLYAEYQKFFKIAACDRVADEANKLENSPAIIIFRVKRIREFYGELFPEASDESTRHEYKELELIVDQITKGGKKVVAVDEDGIPDISQLTEWISAVAERGHADDMRALEAAMQTKHAQLTPEAPTGDELQETAGEKESWVARLAPEQVPPSVVATLHATRAALERSQAETAKVLREIAECLDGPLVPEVMPVASSDGTPSTSPNLEHLAGAWRSYVLQTKDRASLETSAALVDDLRKLIRKQREKLGYVPMFPDNVDELTFQEFISGIGSVKTEDEGYKLVVCQDKKNELERAIEAQLRATYQLEKKYGVKPDATVSIKKVVKKYEPVKSSHQGGEREYWSAYVRWGANERIKIESKRT